MLWSELARSAVHKAAELSDPRAPGPSELLAVICDLSGGAGAEAEGLSTLLRSMGVEASTLRQLALAEPRTEETLHTVLSCAARFQQIEGAAAITCRHLLLAVLQRPTPELQKKLAAVLMPPDVLFTKTLVMGIVPE